MHIRAFCSTKQVPACHPLLLPCASSITEPCYQQCRVNTNLSGISIASDPLLPFLVTIPIQPRQQHLPTLSVVFRPDSGLRVSLSTYCLPITDCFLWSLAIQAIAFQLLSTAKIPNSQFFQRSSWSDFNFLFSFRRFLWMRINAQCMASSMKMIRSIEKNFCKIIVLKKNVGMLSFQ